MVILGIDPGTATTGFGLIHVHGSTLRSIKFGLIETDKNGDPGQRLVVIQREMDLIIGEHKPDIIAIEKLFFATNAKTAMRVGQALGVMLLTAAQAAIPVFEYSPMTVKKLVSGNGRSDKKAVQQSVRKVLGAHVRSEKHKKTHFDNAADALAVALCHLYKEQIIVSEIVV